MVPFAGWEMPLQYRGIFAEAKAVRSEAGIFDVSHMGRLFISGRQAEALLDAFFAEARAEFRAGDGRAALLGFSQGGGMTYRMGLGRPDRFAALVALSASLPDPEVLRPRLPDHREQPVFVAHGLHDQMVSMESARRTREFLDAENYNLSYHEYNMGHEIPVEVLRDMVPWVEAILPPLLEETDRIF